MSERWSTRLWIQISGTWPGQSQPPALSYLDTIIHFIYKFSLFFLLLKSFTFSLDIRVSFACKNPIKVDGESRVRVNRAGSATRARQMWRRFAWYWLEERSLGGLTSASRTVSSPARRSAALHEELSQLVTRSREKSHQLTRISDDSILSRKFLVNSAVSGPQADSTALSLHFMYSWKALWMES